LPSGERTRMAHTMAHKCAKVPDAALLLRMRPFNNLIRYPRTRFQEAPRQIKAGKHRPNVGKEHRSKHRSRPLPRPRPRRPEPHKGNRARYRRMSSKLRTTLIVTSTKGSRCTDAQLTGHIYAVKSSRAGTECRKLTQNVCARAEASDLASATWGAPCVPRPRQLLTAALGERACCEKTSIRDNEVPTHSIPLCVKRASWIDHSEGARSTMLRHDYRGHKSSQP